MPRACTISSSSSSPHTKTALTSTRAWRARGIPQRPPFGRTVLPPRVCALAAKSGTGVKPLGPTRGAKDCSVRALDAWIICHLHIHVPPSIDICHWLIFAGGTSSPSPKDGPSCTGNKTYRRDNDARKNILSNATTTTRILDDCCRSTGTTATGCRTGCRRAR